MKHERPMPARTPVLICLFFGLAVYIALAVYGFAQFGFHLSIVGMFLLGIPAYACAFAKQFGWRPSRRRKPPTAQIRLNLSLRSTEAVQREHVNL